MPYVQVRLTFFPKLSYYNAKMKTKTLPQKIKFIEYLNSLSY